MELLISLKAARINAGLTQQEVATLMGVTKQTISKWERKPSLERIHLLCRIYGIDWTLIKEYDQYTHK